jgi:GR25 family glycosyltransferase involved in LPS biosynthesis
VAASLVNRTLQEKAVALVCSHYRAVEDAKKKNLDFALILEDDAQFINDFWRRLELRLKNLPEKFSVFYLQHACGEAILKLDKRNLVKHNRRPIARRFNPPEVYHLGAGAFDGVTATIWDAGGYLLSRSGIDAIAKRSLNEWLHRSRSSFQIYSSEMLLSEAADVEGAYFSIPPLIYQCTTKTSLIQV